MRMPRAVMRRRREWRYGSMPNTFTSTGGSTHSTSVTGLVDGGNYNYFVRCQDWPGMRTWTISRLVFQLHSRATRHLRCARMGSPSGSLGAGTTQTTLSLTTDENATCRYATTAGVAFGSMPNTFSDDGRNDSFDLGHRADGRRQLQLLRAVSGRQRQCQPGRFRDSVHGGGGRVHGDEQLHGSRESAFGEWDVGYAGILGRPAKGQWGIFSGFVGLGDGWRHPR